MAMPGSSFTLTPLGHKDNLEVREPFSIHLQYNFEVVAPPQPIRVVGFCNQRLMDSRMTMEIKQMGFLVNGIYRNNSIKRLLELLEHVGHEFDAVFPNFFGQHYLIS
ncbi:hypothetical protein TNCV_2572101 [Trichonephila clavipes]|nr:hypothetical protein TNCV_2572101 [Trichonephila clavipes]